MADKTIVCKDCGKEFVFTEGEQEFYKEKGLEHEPVRCIECRKARKAQRAAQTQPQAEQTEEQKANDEAAAE